MLYLKFAKYASVLLSKGIPIQVITFGLAANKPGLAFSAKHA